MIFLLKKKKKFLAVKLKLEETVEPAAFEIIFPMLRDGWSLPFHSKPVMF